METNNFEIRVDANYYLKLQRSNEYDSLQFYGNTYFDLTAKFTKFEDGHYTCWICVNDCYLAHINDIKSFDLKYIKE